MFPSQFPHDLSNNPKLKGENLVFNALQSALQDDWSIFYDWSVQGTRRRVDFICISQTLGIIVFEVKGGLVHNSKGAFKQEIKYNGFRKSITPFDQVMKAYRDIVHACNLEIDDLPKCHYAVFFPEVTQKAFTFTEGLHIFTHEDLLKEKMTEKIQKSLTAPSIRQNNLLCVLINKLKEQTQNNRRYKKQRDSRV
ncbi:MAG: nuclease-related domain-containing protein [Bdellovibrionales bacterium]